MTIHTRYEISGSVVIALTNAKVVDVIPKKESGNEIVQQTTRTQRKRANTQLPQLPGMRDYTCWSAHWERKPEASTGASLKLVVLNSKGRIWTMVAGGGDNPARAPYASRVRDVADLVPYDQWYNLVFAAYRDLDSQPDLPSPPHGAPKSGHSRATPQGSSPTSPTPLLSTAFPLLAALHQRHLQVSVACY
ncbi:hypothetical protein DFH06DRAFT_1318151 [Mycena polygramma]|nr:hypothetical protein DFH06DRAFT_1318151 [Mycena polygramma]